MTLNELVKLTMLWTTGPLITPLLSQQCWPVSALYFVIFSVMFSWHNSSKSKCPENTKYFMLIKLTFSMRGKNFSRQHFEILLLFFQENRLCYFMKIVSWGDNLHNMLTLILLFTTTPTFANSVDPDQMASEKAIWSGSTLFVIQFVILNENIFWCNLIGW